MRRVAFSITCSVLLAAMSDSAPGIESETKLEGLWSTQLGPLGDIHATFEIKDGRGTLVLEPSTSTKVKTTGVVAIVGDGPIYQLDWTGIIGADGKVEGDRKGLARLEGETLTIALGAPGGDRPDGFDVARSRYPSVWTLVPAKPEPQLDPKAVEGALAELQGVWEGSFGPQGNFSVNLRFDADMVKLTFVRAEGQESTVEGTVRIIGGQDPKAMDWVGSNAETGEERVVPAIYEIKGDTMRLRVNLRRDERPKSLEESRETVTLKKKPAESK
jgi:uncharacterized protein (TIGR03067 family)